MVTTVTSYADSRNRAYSIDGYGGVVRVSIGGYYGTGALLYDGRAVLTAAHLFHGTASESASVHFETTSGNQTLTSSRITMLSTYDASNSNNDLALVWLSSAAPTSANRYTLYRGSDEIGQTLTMAGYGSVGSGDSGTLSSYTGSPLRLKADNQFDSDAATLKSTLDSGMAWSPAAGTQLIADFDDGTPSHDALGQLMSLSGSGLGQDEGLIAPGDSGGPAFIDGQIAGVASYIAQLSRNSSHPDIDSTSNSSFGEIGFWQRVSHYQQWIDQSLRAQYPNAPSSAGEVEKVVSESNSGTHHAYFLVQFTGVRSAPEQQLSVDYGTRDGTARAGEDYLAASGTLVLYPDEIQAVIPVEIIGDTTPEPDEMFYLDVTNPVGGSFGEGIVKLTAVRTILNDDF
ncbi:MAG: trypsin-like serine protease [Rhodocyclaceae bacterium]